MEPKSSAVPERRAHTFRLGWSHPYERRHILLGSGRMRLVGANGGMCMLRSMTAAVLSPLLGLVSCGSFEHRFFEGPPATRVERARQFSLEEQFKLFRYGNNQVHPPAMVMAQPIAERGASAIPFLLAKLEEASDDAAIRDVTLIFEWMARSGSYDVPADATAMTALRSKVASMRDPAWREICEAMLRRITDPPPRRDDLPPI